MSLAQLQLKVKVKHLAAEARIIRDMERKQTKQSWRCNLQHHRIWDVRNEARATQLARAFLACKDYKSVESKCTDPDKRDMYIAPRVAAMVRKYGGHNLRRSFTDKDAVNWFRGDSSKMELNGDSSLIG